jgi:hypothetical protein
MMGTEEIQSDHSIFSAELAHFARRAMIDTAAEAERLCELRRHKVFFGDLFRPVRRVLFGKLDECVLDSSAEPADSPIVFVPQMQTLPRTFSGGKRKQWIRFICRGGDCGTGSITAKPACGSCNGL